MLASNMQFEEYKPFSKTLYLNKISKINNYVGIYIAINLM